MSTNRYIGCLAMALCVTGPALWAQGRDGTDKPKTAVSTPTPEPRRPTLDPVQMQAFKTRVDAYVQLHRKAAQSAPPLKQTSDAAQIASTQEALAARIREARAGAKPGDIFTPEVRDVFRRLLAPELKGEDGKDAKAILKDDAPASVPLKVNAKYPEGASRPTVPAAVLGNLPTLPKEVEYRIVDKNLILLDAEAGIVVDYLANAIR